MNRIKIILKDEVNCKIDGLPSDDRKSLSNKFSYEIPGAWFNPYVKLGRWDGKTRFFSIGGATFINLLPEILPEISHYDIELVDNRIHGSFDFEPVDENSYSHINWPDSHGDSGNPIILRDYQVEIINRFLENPQSITIAATGSGKTIITAILSHKCEKYGRTFVIVPNRSLVTQTERDYLNLNLDVGVFFGGRKEYHKTHTICTWQSLNNLIKYSRDGSVDITFDDLIN